jgi:serine/threonine-protein phosphatase 6 regulatory ankyrin repeat subunit B
MKTSFLLLLISLFCIKSVYSKPDNPIPQPKPLRWIKTPLQKACYKGQLDSVTFLLKKGADINQIDDQGYGALHAAAAGNKTDMIDFLLRNGAHVDLKRPETKGKFSVTPLGWAVMMRNVEAADMLMNNNASVLSLDTLGITLMERAVFNDDLEIIKSLVVHGADINQKDQYFWSPIIYAAGNGRTEILKYLVDNGADINVKTSSGRNALHFCAVYGQQKSIDILLEAGVNINVRDNDSSTPLDLVVSPGPMDTVKKTETAAYFIKKGADVNARDKNGATLLHAAAYGGYNDIISLLIDHKADINAEDKYGETALHMAVMNNQPKTVELLVEKKAKLNIKDHNGKTPLDLVPPFKGEDMKQFLITHGGKYGNAD